MSFSLASLILGMGPTCRELTNQSTTISKYFRRVIEAPPVSRWRLAQIPMRAGVRSDPAGDPGWEVGWLTGLEAVTAHFRVCVRMRKNHHSTVETCTREASCPIGLHRRF